MADCRASRRLLSNRPRHYRSLRATKTARANRVEHEDVQARKTNLTRAQPCIGLVWAMLASVLTFVTMINGFVSTSVRRSALDGGGMIGGAGVKFSGH